MAVTTVASRNGQAGQRHSKTDRRIDLVCIRKSGSKQDERGQIANVKLILSKLSVSVPDKHWFVCTVPRANVQGNADFQRLRDLVEADKVASVYVESQDRFGTDDVAELYTLIVTLRNHGTALIDLKQNLDLTARDDTTEMKVFLGGFKSKKERQDIAYRSMRSKVNRLIDEGAWPTGTHPFGFGKSCYSNGKLKWTWQPVSRTKGQLFYPDAKGKLQPVPGTQSIPRNDPKTDLNKLVPSTNKQFLKTVQLIFELFISQGLTRRQISKQLYDADRKFYDRPFTHGLVGGILKNPAYVGDTHYGKTKSAANWSFDGEGNMDRVETRMAKSVRGVEDRIVVKNTHPGLISRDVWKLTQARLKDEDSRTSYAPRNPDYYLKPILVCGHCGKNMTGRTENDPSTKQRRVVYMCSSYITGRTNGQASTCGAHRITHEDAERLLLDKVKEKKLEHDELASETVRKNMERQVQKTMDGMEDKWSDEHAAIHEGTKALREYYKETYRPTEKQYGRFHQEALLHYGGLAYMEEGDKPACSKKDLRSMVLKIETECAAQAATKVDQLTKSLAKYTDAWVDASEMQRDILKKRCTVLEQEIKAWKQRSKPVSQRLEEIRHELSDLKETDQMLMKEWPGMESREKGEALRRVFKTVTLYWDKAFIPRSKTPTRPIKTKRPGRYSYTLLKDKTGWEFMEINLNGSS